MSERFVISRRRAGFGDCLWSLAAAWQYANTTRRTLVIDWRGSCYLDTPFTNAFPIFFEPARELAGVPVICDDAINDFAFPGPFYPPWWNRSVIDGTFRPYEQIHQERMQLGQLFQSRRDSDAATIICDACLMGCSDPDAERQVFRALVPKKEIQERIDAVYREYFQDRTVLGVHVRHGNGEDILGHAPYWADPERAMQQVRVAIHQAKNLPHQKPIRIFLCTDSAEVLDTLSGTFPDLFALPKQFCAENAGPLHTAALGIDGGMMALVEMYLLGRCETVIRFPPTSAFSRYARLFAPRVIEFDLKHPQRLIITEPSCS